MQIENFRAYNFENAIRGARNPLNSWDRSDSEFGATIANSDWSNWLEKVPNEDYLKKNVFVHTYDNGIKEYALIGEKDLDLLQRLIKAGSEHRKFMRQIFVSVDLTLPLYVWKELDQYKVSTVTDSCSTMHTITKKAFTLEDFEVDENEVEIAKEIISILEDLRLKYLETKDMKYWYKLIHWLPENYLQKRTWTGNYEVLRSIYFQRRNHKLNEWHVICDFIKNEVPYGQELITIE